MKYGFLKELGYDENLSLDDYKNNKLIIPKELLLKFLKEEGDVWTALKVVKNKLTGENYIPSVHRLDGIEWTEYLVDLIENNIYPPEELQLFIKNYYKSRQ